MDSWFGFLFQAAVLLQPLFWCWLYDQPPMVPEKFKNLIYIFGLYVAAAVYFSGFSVGFYRTRLIIQYIGMTLLSFQIYNSRYPTQQAVSLAFLTVFLNSFYWEAPLHIVSWLSGEPVANILLQGWRLFPLAFFAKKYELKRSQRTWIEVGLIFSALIMYAGLFYRPYRMILYAINRVICLFILLKTLMEAEVRQHG